MADARDILGVDKDGSGSTKKRGKRPSEAAFKRPEGMHRELYALLQSDYRDPPSLAPTDTGRGYKQSKAKIGRNKVRCWKRIPFTNPARSDDLQLFHYRRITDEKKEYPFAKFGKAQNHVTYTDEEYNLYLCDESGKWSREETDHLFDLSRLFDQRFVVMVDRYDKEKYPNRCMEDLKERYYDVVRKLIEARTPSGQEAKDVPPPYDAQHEKNRKEQLIKLFNRTPEQVEEEEMLVAELKKIEMRKKDREKKSQDIHKLINAAENKPSIATGQEPISSILQDSINPIIKKDKRPGKKNKKKKAEVDPKVAKDQSGIRFPDLKGSGVFLRSSKLKMPPSVGNKKSKAVEQLLEELSVDIIPMPTEDICISFNELRNQLLLLYELRQASSTSEYELQTLRHRYEIMCPGKKVSDLLGYSLDPPSQGAEEAGTSVSNALLIDAVAPLAVGSRKRRTAAALLENNPWKKTRKT